jgi:mRNA interferase RelE/StbE
MPWRLYVAPQAEKDLARLPLADRQAVRRALERLADDFGSVDVTKLAGRGNRWRLRVGRWRVILDLDNSAGQLTVVRVLDRKDAYRA